MKGLVAILSMALGCLALTGCASTGQPGAAQVNFEQSLVSHQVQIKATAGLATRLAILAVPSKNRVQAAAEVHQIALTVQSALAKQNPTLQGAEDIAMEAISKSDSQYADLVATAFEATSHVLDATLQAFYQNTTGDLKTQAGLALLRGVVDGVVEGSQSVSGPTTAPATQPTSMALPPSWPRVPSPFETRAG